MPPIHTWTERIVSPSQWEVMTLLLILSIYAYVQFRYNKVVRSIINLLLYNQLSVQKVRDENVYLTPVMGILTGNFILTMTLLIYKTILVLKIEYFHQPPSLWFFLQVFFLVSGLVVGRILLNRILGTLFKVEGFVSDYFFSYFTINTVTSVCLFPVILGLFFLPSKEIVLTIGTIIFAIISIFNIVRSSLLARTQIKLSFFYLFLYLCAVEIMPMVYLYGMIKEN